MDHKICTKCGQEKLLDAFSKCSAAKSGIRSACRECCSTSSRAWREANLETFLAGKRKWREANDDKVRAWHRDYHEANRETILAGKREYRQANPEVKRNQGHRRRARKAENGVFLVTKKDIARLLLQPCAYCGAVAEHIDHVIPISRGGAHKIGNLVAACSSCNLRKGSKLLSVWRLGNSGQQGKVEK
jgi:5-methylcytosine-specific restriction endonuclease McrA